MVHLSMSEYRVLPDSKGVESEFFSTHREMLVNHFLVCHLAVGWRFPHQHQHQSFQLLLWLKIQKI